MVHEVEVIKHAIEFELIIHKQPGFPNQQNPWAEREHWMENELKTLKKVYEEVKRMESGLIDLIDNRETTGSKWLSDYQKSFNQVWFIANLIVSNSERIIFWPLFESYFKAERHCWYTCPLSQDPTGLVGGSKKAEMNCQCKMCAKSRIRSFENASRAWSSSNKLHWNGKIASESNSFWNNVRTIFFPVHIYDVHPKPKPKTKSSKIIPGIISSAKTALVQKVIKTKPSELYLLKREAESGCKFRQIFK